MVEAQFICKFVGDAKGMKMLHFSLDTSSQKNANVATAGVLSIYVKEDDSFAVDKLYKVTIEEVEIPKS